MIVGLFLKHIKAYKGISFIPLGSKHKFINYIGENGSGKSSILEAFDSFFNYKPYSINKSALNDGINTVGNEPFVAPIFLIKKTKVKQHKKNFEQLSNYFWSVSKSELHPSVQKSVKGFFEVRAVLEESSLYSSDSYFLFVFGENNLNSGVKPYFGSFHGEEKFLNNFFGKKITKDSTSPLVKKSNIRVLREQLKTTLEKKEWKDISGYLKEMYSYVYFPVEIDVESLTKIETKEMQKIFDKKIRKEIGEALLNVNFTRKGGINSNLDLFVSDIEDNLNNEYCYDTGKSRNNSVTKSDIVNKILEVYFQKRVLNRKSSIGLTKVSELSAGEKRQAIINLIYASLKRTSEREAMVIIAIDEPENSLHTALCYDQFEKLKEVSENNQVLVTTHWYGFLPIVSEGYAHFLNLSNNKINFETYDLYNYRSEIKVAIESSKNQIPSNFVLKSTNDLVQSIFYSIKHEIPYNWIICEGVSEKIYFEYFFDDDIKNNKLRILPMGGRPQVIRLYKYLLNPISEDKCAGKVYCLIDTDRERCEEINNGCKNLTIRRLSNMGTENSTELLTLKHSDTSVTDIEQVLNPVIFKETIEAISDNELYHISSIKDESGNSDFIKNFKNLDLEDYFKENFGENKVLFAKKYVEISKLHKSSGLQRNTHPNWVDEIAKFFIK